MIEIRTFVLTIAVILVIAFIFYQILIKEVEERERLSDEMMWILIRKLSRYEPFDLNDVYQEALEIVHRKIK